jgi:hypothetical protein
MLGASPAFAQPAGGPPPGAFSVDWPFARDNPRPEEHALALFTDDEFNRAPVCPEEPPNQLPSGRLRCSYEPTSILSLGPATLWAGVARDESEFDGMYTHSEHVVLLVAQPSGPPVVAHTLTQWKHEVYDCFSTLTMRRRRTIDLDRDGQREICIESIEERGAGLGVVMHLGDTNARWYPAERARSISAWSLDANARQLVRRTDLDAACPRRGYTMFAPTSPYRDPLGWRRSIQGEDPRGLARGRRWIRTPGCGWDYSARPVPGARWD